MPFQLFPEYALSMHGSGTELDTLHFYTLMIKLLEASHLIYMREVTPVSDLLINSKAF
ncbi:hypothetical protein [Niabella aquatica]